MDNTTVLKAPDGIPSPETDDFVPYPSDETTCIVQIALKQCVVCFGWFNGVKNQLMCDEC
jgi:hypothetical protein